LKLLITQLFIQIICDMNSLVVKFIQNVLVNTTTLNIKDVST